ncbi:MAG: T9SS type A sorting domain-containing protein [Saprospiraceae bacterium]|nr:T9SS type A sorting domain-containing protein [Saprospiraceae bacterium]
MKKLRLLNALLFLAGAVVVHAQPISPVDQGNLPQFMAEMDAYYNGLVTIPASEVEAFISQGFPVSDSDCPYPATLEITSMTDNELILDWDAVPDAVAYHVGYLNLNTGDHANVTIGTSVPRYIFNPLPNGFYLFTVQAECGASHRSMIDIVIGEKVVHLEVDNTLNCVCKAPLNTLSDSDGHVNITTWSEFFAVFLPGSGYEFTIPFKKGPLYEGLPSYYFKQGCDIVALNLQNNIIHINNSDNSLLGSVQFMPNAGDVEMVYTTTQGIIVNIIGCTKSPPHIQRLPDNEQTAFHAAPNPFADKLSINLPETPATTQQVSLWDGMGRLLRQSSQANTTFDTSALPPGLYLLKIKNGQEESVQKVVKY